MIVWKSDYQLFEERQRKRFSIKGFVQAVVCGILTVGCSFLLFRAFGLMSTPQEIYTFFPITSIIVIGVYYQLFKLR